MSYLSHIRKIDVYAAVDLVFRELFLWLLLFGLLGLQSASPNRVIEKGGLRCVAFQRGAIVTRLILPWADSV